MAFNYVPSVGGTKYGTIDPSQFGRTGSAYTDPSFFKLYMAQLERQSFDVLFGEEGVNNSIFGNDSAGAFGTTPSATDPMFGGMGGASLPSDIAGASTQTNGSQYFELIARSNLIGKMVEAVDPMTREQFSGRVTGVTLDNGILLIDIGGKKVPAEYLLKVSQ